MRRDPYIPAVKSVLLTQSLQWIISTYNLNPFIYLKREFCFNKSSVIAARSFIALFLPYITACYNPIIEICNPVSVFLHVLSSPLIDKLVRYICTIDSYLWFIGFTQTPSIQCGINNLLVKPTHSFTSSNQIFVSTKSSSGFMRFVFHVS